MDFSYLKKKHVLFSRINQSQTPTEAEDGPPELLVRKLSLIFLLNFLKSSSLFMVDMRQKSLIFLGISMNHLLSVLFPKINMAQVRQIVRIFSLY